MSLKERAGELINRTAETTWRPIAAAGAILSGQAAMSAPTYAEVLSRPQAIVAQAPDFDSILSAPRTEISAQISAPDFPINGPDGEVGWFYTQTGNSEKLEGFEIVDDKDAKFWTAFQKFGGVASLGYPISGRFTLEGFTYQATQNGFLQWRSEANEAVFANIADMMSEKGYDNWLETQGIPKPFSGNDGATSWEDAKRIRLSWLTDDDIQVAYFANPNPEEIPNWESVVYRGLPASKPEEMGPFIAQRLQRGAILKWVDRVPGGQPVGTIQFANLGTLAAKAGMVPQDALIAKLNRFGGGGGGTTIEAPVESSRDFKLLYPSPDGKSEIRNIEGSKIGLVPNDEAWTFLRDMFKDFGLSGNFKILPAINFRIISGYTYAVDESYYDYSTRKNHLRGEQTFFMYNMEITADKDVVVSYQISNPDMTFTQDELDNKDMAQFFPSAVADAKEISTNDTIVRTWLMNHGLLQKNQGKVLISIRGPLL